MYALSIVQDVNELRQHRGGSSQGDVVQMVWQSYPTIQTYMFYVWDNNSIAAESGWEIIAPYEGTVGRWIRVNCYGSVQVNSDWNSASGVTQILNKPTIPILTYSTPTARTLSLATAYQASDNTKPAQISVNLTSTSSISLGGAVNNEGEIRIGPLNTVASGASGTPIGIYKNDLGGTLVVGLNMNVQGCQTVSFTLPIGWYFAVRQTLGSGISIVSAYDQSIG